MPMICFRPVVRTSPTPKLRMLSKKWLIGALALSRPSKLSWPWMSFLSGQRCHWCFKKGCAWAAFPQNLSQCHFDLKRPKLLSLPELGNKGVPIVAVLNGGRTVKLEVPYQLSQLELAQIKPRSLTSLRKSTSVEDAWPFPTGNEVDQHATRRRP